MQNNITNQSFSKAKKRLLNDVYQENSVKRTLYCNAGFDENKAITLPEGFDTSIFTKRSKSVEVEHVVPAENFGRTFLEWREGHPDCINSKGKPFKGRKCAEKINIEYRLMQSDMYNLYPAIGSVNAARKNYNFMMLPDAKSSFGSCDFRVQGRKVQPPENSRGQIARAYLYMENSYPKYSMSKSQRQLMTAWDKEFPVTVWECERSRRIEKIQGNKNSIMDARCQIRQGNNGYFGHRRLG